MYPRGQSEGSPVSDTSSPIRLISPDDRTELRRSGDAWVDRSGHRYGYVGATLDLRPKEPVRGTLPYEIADHETFRSFPYRISLRPLFPRRGGVTGQKAQAFKEVAIQGFIPPAEPGAWVLDHGCGAGKLRAFLESQGYSYAGADNETGTTTEQGGGHEFKGGATHLCDLHRLPFAADAFQFVVSYSVFEHLQNPLVGAAELFRVLKPGGICLVVLSAVIPFHMDSFYNHTHFGVLATFRNAGFEIDQIAPAKWSAFVALPSMDGLPGPRLLRVALSQPLYRAHQFLWWLRTRVKHRDPRAENLRRNLAMAGIMKAVLRKPTGPSADH
jgi:SAM-dependent methyltransferase